MQYTATPFRTNSLPLIKDSMKPPRTRYEPTLFNLKPSRTPYTMDIRVLAPGTYGVQHTLAAQNNGIVRPWPEPLKYGPCDSMNYVPIVIPDVPLSSIMRQRYDVRGQNPFYNGLTQVAGLNIPTIWTTQYNDVGDYSIYFSYEDV